MSFHRLLFIFLFVLSFTASTASLSRAQDETCDYNYFSFDSDSDSYIRCVYEQQVVPSQSDYQDQGVTSDSIDEALIWASGEGDIDRVKLLLDAGASINWIDESSGNTAILQAARNGHFDIVDLLRERGADSTIKSYSYEQIRKLEIVQNLLEADTDIELFDNDNRRVGLPVQLNKKIEIWRALETDADADIEILDTMDDDSSPDDQSVDKK